MRREFSAGGVVIRRAEGGHEIAVIQPQGKPEGHWVLPKGALDAGETSEQAALREVREETGLDARSLGKLGATKYVYTWHGEKIFKVVTFFLMGYVAGEIGAIDESMHVEVAAACWLPLAEAVRGLAHKGEREMAEKAQAAIPDHDL